MNITRVPLLLRIIVAIVLGIGFGTFVPGMVVRTFNTFNGVFDQLLKFLIPLIIVGLVTSAIGDIGKGAKRMLIIMAAVGILDSILGFSPEDQAMMITLYIAMDSFGTACNVTGDGAIALVIDRWYKKICL